MRLRSIISSLVWFYSPRLLFWFILSFYQPDLQLFAALIKSQHSVNMLKYLAASLLDV